MLTRPGRLLAAITAAVTLGTWLSLGFWMSAATATYPFPTLLFAFLAIGVPGCFLVIAVRAMQKLRVQLSEASRRSSSYP